MFATQTEQYKIFASALVRKAVLFAGHFVDLTSKFQTGERDRLLTNIYRCDLITPVAHVWPYGYVRENKLKIADVQIRGMRVA